MAERITTKYLEWIDAAVDRHAFGEVVAWDMSLGFTEQGPIMMVVLVMPSLVLGEQITTVGALPLAITEPQLDEGIRGMLGALRERRSSDTPGDLAIPPVSSNGHRSPH